LPWRSESSFFSYPKEGWEGRLVALPGKTWVAVCCTDRKEKKRKEKRQKEQASKQARPKKKKQKKIDKTSSLQIQTL
jgi:hypothetical protein